jgi:hypothetical protein
LLHRKWFSETSKRCPAVYAYETDWNLSTISCIYLGIKKIINNRYDKDAIYMSLDSPNTGKFAIKMSQNEQTYNGVKGKYAIGEIKRYKVLGMLWRHERQHINKTSSINMCCISL